MAEQESLIMIENYTTYADEYGIWHCVVRLKASMTETGIRQWLTTAQTTARKAILTELVAREQKVGESEHSAYIRLDQYLVIDRVTEDSDEPDVRTNMVHFVESVNA